MIQRIGKFEQFTSIENDGVWNHLWEASADVSPLARAEILEIYQAAFCKQPIQRLGVEEGGGWAAGISLVSQKQIGFPQRLTTPNNPWVQCGGLLVDPLKWSSKVSKRLAQKLANLPTSWLQFDWVEETPEWNQLCHDLRQVGCEVGRTLQFETGVIATEGDWEQYFARRSTSFRKKLRNRLRKLEGQGCVEFVRHTLFESSEAALSCIDQALAIEHQTWKGEQQTSLNSCPEIRQAFVAMLLEFARLGLLEVQFLKLDQQVLAFEIGFRSHGTYYSCKIGFDPGFSKFSPGQLLTYFQLKNWFAGDEIQRVDTIGELSQATGKWCDGTLPRYRYTVATGRLSGSILRLWAKLKPRLKRWLRR